MTSGEYSRKDEVDDDLVRFLIMICMMIYIYIYGVSVNVFDCATMKILVYIIAVFDSLGSMELARGSPDI